MKLSFPLGVSQESLKLSRWVERYAWKIQYYRDFLRESCTYIAENSDKLEGKLHYLLPSTRMSGNFRYLQIFFLKFDCNYYICDDAFYLQIPIAENVIYMQQSTTSKFNQLQSCLQTFCTSMAGLLFFHFSCQAVADFTC